MALAILLTTTSCAGPAESGSAGVVSTPATEPMVVLVIGDSIPYNSPDDCPGCTGFADSFAKALTTEGKGEVKVRNMSRHDGAKTQDMAKQLTVDTNLIAEFGTADVVLLSFGFNDQPPYAEGFAGSERQRKRRRRRFRQRTGRHPCGVHRQQNPRVAGTFNDHPFPRP